MLAIGYTRHQQVWCQYNSHFSILLSHEEVSYCEALLYINQIYRREHMLKDRIPSGLTPALTSSFGDCLFGSVSVCLFGTIEYEKVLRLAAIIHGIDHYDHYLEMVRLRCTKKGLDSNAVVIQFVEKIESISDAVQFMSTTVSCDDILENSIFESQTPSQVINYTLTNELRATAKVGCYSGT